jgi:tetratricopeptide (TPR) repeat protein
MGLFKLMLLIFSAFCLLSSCDKNNEKVASQNDTITVDSAPSMSAFYLSGKYALQNSDMQSAVKILDEALKHEPENEMLLKNAYNAALVIGDVEKAVEIAKQYSAKDHNDVVQNILLATYAVHNGDFAGSEETLNKITKVDEVTIPSTIGTVILPFLKIWAKVGQGKYDEALQYSEEISGTAKAPSPFMYYQRALIADLEGKKDEAGESYAASVKENIILPYHFIRAAGNFYERTNDSKKAEVLYKKYRQQQPQLGHFSEGLKRIAKQRKPIEKMVIADALAGFNDVLKEAVRVANSSGFYDEGLSYLRLALYLSPKDEEANMLLADYYEKNNEFMQAIKIYRKNIEYKSDFYFASKVAIAENLYYLGKKNQGVKMLMKLMENEQVSNTTLLSLADILRKDGKYKEAKVIYSQVIDNIKKPEFKHWVLFFARGICNEKLGNWKASEADLLKALELKPNQPEVLNYLAYSWVDMDKNITEAKSMLAIAIKARPQDPQILDSVGWVLYKTADYDSAAKFLERAAEITPYDPVINEHLGDTYWMQGRIREAKVQWQRVLQYNKTSEDVDLKSVEKKLKNGMAQK